MTKRLRALAVATTLVGGMFAATLPAQAGVCYDLHVELDGEVIVSEADCLA